MPSLFKTNSVAQLESRLAGVDIEISSLMTFRKRILRRILHLKTRAQQPNYTRQDEINDNSGRVFVPDQR